jgi:hypothetical protein
MHAAVYQAHLHLFSSAHCSKADQIGHRCFVLLLLLLLCRGGHDIVHIEDAAGNRFATRISNVFVIGKGNKPLISLPKGKGVRLTILQEQAKRYASA